MGPRAGRLVARRAGALALVAALAVSGGCSLRLGSGVPGSLPTMDQSQGTRDALARDAVLIASAASSVADGGGGDDVADDAGRQRAAALAEDATEQAQALGGVWEPWPTAVPTSYPTPTPVATASPGSGTGALVSALEQGVTRARGAALSTADAREATLYSSLTVSWSAALAVLAPEDEAVVAAPREAATMTEALSGERLLAYDASRYAMEEVAARASGDERARAVADASAAGDVVSASVALGGTDSRLAAYAPPVDAGAAGTDVTWARQAWSEVAQAEVAGTGSESGQAREASLDAAVDATLRAAAWGAAVPALPGYAVGATATPSAPGSAVPTPSASH